MNLPTYPFAGIRSVCLFVAMYSLLHIHCLFTALFTALFPSYSLPIRAYELCRGLLETPKPEITLHIVDPQTPQLPLKRQLRTPPSAKLLNTLPKPTLQSRQLQDPKPLENTQQTPQNVALLYPRSPCSPENPNNSYRACSLPNNCRFAAYPLPIR
jgi:hypothetical protein